MRDTHNIYVEQLAAPRLKRLHFVGRFAGTVGKNVGKFVRHQGELGLPKIASSNTHNRRMPKSSP
jgi:hypothetical protein